MFKSLFFSIAVFVLMLSCSGSGRGMSGDLSDMDSLYADSIELLSLTDTLELFEEEVLPKSADELFNDFFYNYASDGNFRKMRTTYKYDSAAGDSVLASSMSSNAAFRELTVKDFYAVVYEREEELVFQKDTSLSEVIVERMDLDAGIVEQFDFRRYDGTWVMQDVTSTTVDDTPNSDFLAFYTSFSADSVGRFDNIAEPLKFVMTAEDDEGEDEIVEMGVDEWKEISSDFPLPSHEIINVNYGQTCISNNNKLLLVVGISNGLSLKYRFMKQDGRWMLVEVEV